MSHETVYLVPGLFGFTRLAGYDYFGHLSALLRERLTDLEVVTLDTLPTASVRRRANQLSQAIEEREHGRDRPIHLIGHSTGGLECRLLLSPGARLREERDRQWRRRVRSLITMNTPHFGTPSAEFFTSSSRSPRASTPACGPSPRETTSSIPTPRSASGSRPRSE